MKKAFLLLISLTVWMEGYCQTDTISDNIYQNSGRLGIGVDNPTHSLEIEDSISSGIERNFIKLINNSESNSAYTGIILETGITGGHSVIQSYGINYTASSPYDFGGFLNISNASNGINYIANSEDGTHRFYTKGTINILEEKMRIDKEGNLGIGTNNPKVKLDINGGLRISNTDSAYSGTIRWTGIDFEGFNGSEWLSLSSFNNNFWNNNNNGLYYNSGNIGIGSTSNNHLLELQSDINSGVERNLIKISNLSNGNSAYTGIILSTGDNKYQSVIQDYGINYSASTYYDFGGFLNLSNNSNGLMLHANSSNGIIKFYTGHDQIAGAGIERLRIDSTGNIGIGTKEPTAKLQVADGDIYISDIKKGIIMKSPDGNCWRGVLDNSGHLIFSSIECPETDGGANNIQQLKTSDNIFVYPNPSSTLIYVDLSKTQYQKSEYKIYDLSGQLQVIGKVKSDNQSIDISNLSIGAYILTVFDKKGDKLTSQKIIKK